MKDLSKVILSVIGYFVVGFFYIKLSLLSEYTLASTLIGTDNQSEKWLAGFYFLIWPLSVVLDLLIALPQEVFGLMVSAVNG